MINKRTIQNNLSQIFAITEKNIKLGTRFKFKLIFSFISPIISIIIPIIIMGKFFDFNIEFGPWDANNYIVFILLAYEIMLLQRVINKFPKHFINEKYWQTLPSLIIAPLNRINILFGIVFSQLIITLIPMLFFFILCYIIYPISLFPVLFMIGIFFLIALMFSGIGIIMGILAISKENWAPIVSFAFGLFFITTCITFPYEVFPGIIQFIVNLNPLYHVFYFLRIAWIENDLILSITSHFPSFICLVGLAIVLPCIGVIIFNKIYKKYGIVGY